MKTFRSASFPLMATATPGLAALLLSASLLAPTAACARESAQAAPRAVAPRGALLSEEQAVVSLFEQSSPSVAYITTETVQRGVFGADGGGRRLGAACGVTVGDRKRVGVHARLLHPHGRGGCAV